MSFDLLSYLGAAFLGGLILNVMPCVLPVLTMKVFHVVEHAQSERRTIQLHGLAYTAGVMSLFVVLAAAVIGLRASGELVGWGMQFQNPAFVAAMTALMVGFGLNALGVFEISLSVSGGGDDKGYLSSFSNGVFASLMSTPCSAPFLGTAAAFALASDTAWWETLLLFLGIGFGLASPFLLISFVPGLAKVLPRPGQWMITFKQLMGFSLFGAAVWLFGVLQKQVSSDSATLFLGFLVLMSVALWGIEAFGGLRYGTGRRVLVRALALGLVILGVWGMVDLSPRAPEAAVVASADAPVVLGDKINWAPFDSARVAQERGRGRPVFIDYTADWCANCKANEKAFIEVQAVRDTFQQTNILPMKADLTNDNEEIWRWVKDQGRSAIPVYVIYLPNGEVDLLPVAITTELLTERLQEASAAFPPAGFRAGGAHGQAGELALE
jgi:thiol:disulfide interchange protein